jgi:hypothetical protein
LIEKKPVFEPELQPDQAIKIEYHKEELEFWFKNILSEFEYFNQIELIVSKGSFQDRIFLHENATRTQLAETLLSQRL